MDEKERNEAEEHLTDLVANAAALLGAWQRLPPKEADAMLRGYPEGLRDFGEVLHALIAWKHHEAPQSAAVDWQARARADHLHRIILIALAYEREAFEEDTDVEGADLCEFFSGWRDQAQAALVTMAIYGPDRPLPPCPTCKSSDNVNTEAVEPYYCSKCDARFDDHGAASPVPISAPGSTVEDLENDRAALEVLRGLAEWGAEAARRVTGGYMPGHVSTVYQDHVGGPDAVVAWVRQKLAETENSIDARTGGMPEPGEGAL